ncbi:DUF551 domain-containing protein [Neisseria sp. Dent CA1/247]|uniref:DUF551 domain-containing protein n=1 Tax=Neisseria sp. Dent CA1/247 TaxID=2912675 RepID=UPI001FD345F5|nr:DUF551 domain-containing protein [Neisseria sp. Dent CA1/247]UOO77968.1 DUF551 domain-containing protein [Neisseria sp. Dent CA1/247]
MTQDQVHEEIALFNEWFGSLECENKSEPLRLLMQLAWLGAKEQAAEQNRWIDIKTELPETFQTVIVFTSNGYIYSDWRIDDTEELEWEFTVDAEVLYWKPLPAPPEKE